MYVRSTTDLLTISTDVVLILGVAICFWLVVIFSYLGEISSMCWVVASARGFLASITTKTVQLIAIRYYLKLMSSNPQ